MTYPCPKSCGRLATAAAYVSISVVQFIAGLLLLRSEYVYLLAVPNFWTSASNFAVGCLLGTSTGVWKDVHKSSIKHATRRHILAALVFTAIMINSTTAIIFILGESHNLLSIRLENGGKYSSATLTGEILAYSYATSVCSPIICTVVGIFFLTGIWFRRSNSEELTTSEIRSILKEDGVSGYNWVFTDNLPKTDPRTMKRTLSNLSLSDNESFSPINTSFRFRASSDSKVFRNLKCECGERFKPVDGKTSLERDRISLAHDSMKNVKFLNDLSFKSLTHSGHFDAREQFHQHELLTENTEVNSLGQTKFQIKNPLNGDLKLYSKRSRMSLREHPAFRGIEMSYKIKNSHNLHNSSFPPTCSFRSHVQTTNKVDLSIRSEVEADIHTDSRSFNNCYSAENHEMSPETDTLIYEVDLDKVTDNIHCANGKFQRSSSYKSLKDSKTSHSDENKHNSRILKDRRTSTTASLNSSRFSLLDISNIETDSRICQPEPHVENSAVTNLAHNSLPNISRMNSVIDTEDSVHNAPESNHLVGEVVAVRVNSFHRKSLPTKLIPVSIPMVSRIKILPLANGPTDMYSTPQMKCSSFTPKRVDKFAKSKEISFSSFSGGTMDKNRRCMSVGENYINHFNTKYAAATYSGNSGCEIFPEGNHTLSPSHTSGYASAFEETILCSNSDNSRVNLTATSSTSMNDDVPKSKKLNYYSSPTRNNRKSSESKSVPHSKIINRLIKDGPNANKELISQLMNEVSFRKAGQQTMIYETKI